MFTGWHSCGWWKSPASRWMNCGRERSRITRNHAMSFWDRREFLAASGQLALGICLGGKTSVFAAAPPVPLRILFFGGALSEVQKELEKQYVIHAIKGGQKPGNGKEDNVIGLEQLANADVWVGSGNKRTFPSDEQLGHFKKFL